MKLYRLIICTRIHLSCIVTSILQVAIAATNGNETDQLALVAFRTEILDDPFKALSSWNESVHFCQWRGVKCSSRHQRVTTLDLSHQKLGGPLSPHIGNMSFLRELKLDNNSFTGELPSELGRLQRLQLLWLRNNSLAGEIPANLSTCSSLLEIRLSWNNLVGKLPSEFGALSKLQLIQAPRNNLTGSIPRSFGNLSSLEFLGFSSNSISGAIPDDLGRLSKLEYIGFSENKLSGMLPSTMFNLSSMTTIFLPLNQLQGTIPSDFGSAYPKLDYFAIEGNQFSGSIPASLSNLSNLEFLFLGSNRLTGEVPVFHKLNKLRRLGLSGNLLGRGGVDDLNFISSLSNATNLEELGLADNNLGGVLPESFGNLSTKLTGLYLSKNQLSGSIPYWLPKFSNLTNIEMGSNEFTGIIPSTIGMFQKLQVLDLSRNKFSGRIPSVIGNLSMLIKLHLDGNKLDGAIPPALGQCINLEALNLSRNMLNGSIPYEVFYLSSLTLYLDLSHNKLDGSLPVEVGNLNNLGELHVSANMFSGKIPSTLEKCVRLEKLYMDRNFFQGILPSALSSLRGIRFLDLSQNNLSGEIPEYLGALGLQYLNLSYNAFDGPIPGEGIFRNWSAISVTGNPRLCGGVHELQLPECDDKQSKKVASTFIFRLIISIVSGLLGLGLLLVVLFIYWSRTKKGPVGESADYFLPKVSYQTLSRATNGFSAANLLGVGSYASVYQGFIEHDVAFIAVKVFNLLQHGAAKSFTAECESLRNVRHRNLVKVLTVCSGVDHRGNDFKALVYEYMSNGSLEEWLHPSSAENSPDEDSKKLSLLQRLDIAIDIAYALDYLQHQCHKPVIHSDLKPSNVLLDDDMVAHVSDFGLARILPTAPQSPRDTSGVKGSFGYMPPEYGMGSKVSTSGDVYSFGILLMEIFTGMRPTNDMFRDGLTLHGHVRRALPDRMLQIIDPVILNSVSENETSTIDAQHNNSFTESLKFHECLNSVFMVGLSCSGIIAGERMDISVAAAELQRAKNVLLKD